MDNNYTLQLASRSASVIGTHQAPKPSLASILKQRVTNAALGWLLPMLLMVFSVSTGLNAQTVTAFNPTSGVTGTTVTITGTDFTNVSAVAFNGVNSAYFVSSASTILAQVPAGATTGTVCVTTNVGTGCSAFNFIIGAPVPSITSFSPTSGNTGTNVSITGQNFTGVDSVQFNGTKVTSFTVNSSTNISATVPVGATTGPIRIFTTAGSVTSSSNFNVLNGGGAAPTITSFSPTSGPVGTTVTITGLNLAAVTSVFIGGISCAIISTSNNSLTITIPAGAPTAAIQVFNSLGGTQSASSFTVTGAAGLCFAGTPITLALPFTTSWQNALARTGNATLTTFAGVANETYSLSLCNTTLDTYIRIYDALGNQIAFNDDNGPYCANSSASLDWVCPSAGTYRILITGYPCSILNSDVIVAFKRGTANSNPTITNFTPTSGFTGTLVTINGTNLDQITGATISGVAATLGTQTASALQITVGAGTTTGPIVLTYSGGSISTSPSVFTVTGSCAQISSNSGPITPTLAWQSISPAAGFVNRYSFTAAAGDVYSFRTCNTVGTANTKLRILDAGFNEVAVFDDNGPYCTGNKASGDFTTTTSGTYFVLLSIANCTAPTSTIALDYKVTPTTPTITSFSPISGPVGTTVTLTGTNLSGVTSITINGAVQNVSSISSTTIIFNIAAGTNTGLIQLNYSGGSVLSSSQFTVVTSASCYANTTFSRTITPTTVWQTLSGLAGTSPRYGVNGVVGWTYNFSACATSGDTKLRIYDASGNELASFDDNGPYCTGGSASGNYSPATSGLFYVGLTQYDCNPLAVTSILSYKQELINALPTIVSFTPTSGPAGTTVTVSGTNFNFVTSVLVNGVASGSINIVSGTQLTFVVPAGATTGVITLNYGGGSVSSTTNFTVTATSTCFSISSLNATLAPTTTWAAAQPPVGVVRRYGFTGTVGNTYNFSTCATGALNPTRIRIYDNNGVELAVYDGNGPYCNTIRASGDFTPTTSGNYFVVISDFDCNVLSSSTSVQYKYTPTAITPTLISFSPASGNVGSTVTLTGTQLQLITQVRINGTLATITSQSSNTITITVAPGTTTGLITLAHGTGSITSSSVYTVNATASCFSASAYTGDITFSTTWQTSTPPIGVIRRYGFNPTVGNTYSFSTCSATGTNATRIRIYNALGVELAVYSGNGPHCTGSKASGDFTPTSSGPHFVVFSNADCALLSQTTPLQYRFAPTVVTPTITGINPASGPIGANVIVSGTDLNNLTSIEINGVTQILTPLNSTSASITIQAGTTTGLVTGTYTGGVVNSSLTFTVTTASTCYGSTINGGTLTPNASWQSLSVPAGSIRRWSINGVAGTTYNFNTCSNTATNDNKIRIYDPAGNEITFFDDNGPYCATSKASGDYTPGTSGTFWVSLSDYDCNPLSQANTVEYKLTAPFLAPTIISFSPTSGPIGTLVTIVGTNLTSIASASINGTAANITSQSANSITIAVGPGTTTGLITLNYSTGSISTSSVYTVNTAASCFSLSTLQGSITPTTVWQSSTPPVGVIRRYGFNATVGNIYSFSSCTATGTNDTRIRIYDASGIELAVFSANGPYCTGRKASGDFTPTSSGTYYVVFSDLDCRVLSQSTPLQFRYTPAVVAPTITSFSPGSGPVGTSVTIVGTDLTAVTAANINGTSAAITAQTANSISITVGAGTTTGLITLSYATGSVSSTSNFVVTTANALCYSPATSRGSLVFTTTFNTVVGNVGTAPYWTFNAIAGNLYRLSTCGASVDTKLRIYDASLNEVTNNDDNGPLCVGSSASIEFVPLTSGVYTVLLTTFDCIPLTATVQLSYTRVDPFAVRSVVPSSGYAFDNVQIKGAGFTGATNVTFTSATGVVSVVSFIVVNDSTITTAVPIAAVTGTVCVTAANGQILCTGSVFTVLTLPVLCSTADYAGRLTMTTSFQALNLNVGFRPTFVFNTVAGRTYTFRTCGSTGTNDTKIRIYDLAGLEVAMNDDNGPYCGGAKASIDFVAPATGSYYVMITDYDCNPVSQIIYFDYKTSSAVPVITSFTPASGPVGTNVTISGINFTGATSVAFNGTTATGLLVVNSTTATAVVANGSTTGLVRITTPSGSAVSTSNFVVTVTPTITSFTPTSGPVGTVVTLTGTNFTGATSVTINGTAATGLTVLSSTSARATVAAGTTTGPVRIITPNGSAFGPVNYVVTVVCNLRLSITGQSGTAVTATISNGTPPYRYVVNGGATTNVGTATTTLPIVVNSRNVITVTDANNCTATSALFFRSGVVCGSRLLPSATDSVTMFHIPASSGTTSVMFDGATFPSSSQLFATGSQVGTTTAAGTNPSNLTGVTGANAVAVVRAPIGTAWQGWLTCNAGAISPRTNIGSSAQATCNSTVVFASFPFRQTSAIGSTAQSFSPSLAGQTVKLDLDAVRLEAGQRIEVFYNLTGIGAPVATITGNYATNSVFSWTSNAANGALYLRFTGTNGNQFPGIVARVSCVPLVLPNSIRLGSLASTGVCAGSTVTVPVNLTGSYTYPLTATAYLSDGSGSFSGPLAIGTASLTSASGAVTATIPSSLILPGNYRLRVNLTAPALISDTVALTINAIPAAPTISTPAGTSACAGQTVLLEGPFGATGYLWSNSQTTRQIRVQPGSYTLSISTNGCPSPASAAVTVTNLPTPVAAFTQRNDTLFATPTGAAYQWLYNNGIIPGATGPFLKVSFNGAYSVIVTQGTCADTSASQLINSLSANQLGGLRLVLYPNPASKLVTLVAQPEAWRGSGTIIVTNALGQTVLQVPASPSADGTQPIDITALPAGRYMVSLKGSGSYQALVVQ